MQCTRGSRFLRHNHISPRPRQMDRNRTASSVGEALRPRPPHPGIWRSKFPPSLPSGSRGSHPTQICLHSDLCLPSAISAAQKGRLAPGHAQCEVGGEGRNFARGRREGWTKNTQCRELGKVAAVLLVPCPRCLPQGHLRLTPLSGPQSLYLYSNDP